MKLSDLTQKDRIQILLSEYAALRDEILTRTTIGIQIPAAALAGITWFLQQELVGRSIFFWIIMGFVILGFCIVSFVNARDGSRVALRLKQIEHEVNSRAGEHLLVWETLGGVITQMSLTKSWFTRVKTLPSSELPALDPLYLEREMKSEKGSAQ